MLSGNFIKYELLKLCTGALMLNIFCNMNKCRSLVFPTENAVE